VRDEVYREIGRIVGPKGVRGELKIAPDSDDPMRLTELARLYIGDDVSSLTNFDIRSACIQPSRYGPTLVVQLDGLDSRGDAEALGKKAVFALESELPTLEAGEFYLSDLVGLEVRTADGKRLGEILDVYDLPAQTVLLVRLDGGGESMIPAVSEFVKRVDQEEGCVIVNPIDGMF